MANFEALFLQTFLSSTHPEIVRCRQHVVFFNTAQHFFKNLEAIICVMPYTTKFSTFLQFRLYLCTQSISADLEILLVYFYYLIGTWYFGSFLTSKSFYEEELLFWWQEEEDVKDLWLTLIVHQISLMVFCPTKCKHHPLVVSRDVSIIEEPLRK